jgi:carbonic anhydrase
MCETCVMSRRGALVGGLAVAAGAALPFGKARAQDKIGPDRALEMLMEGNARYVSGQTELRDFSADRAALALGQKPFAVILGCADSRVAPELAFDQSRGQLFVLRVAGNTLNNDTLASTEFALAALGAPLVMVLGHSACGAVDAAIKVVQDGAELPGHLPELIAPIKPAVERALGEPGDLLANTIDENVRLTASQLGSAGPIVAPLVGSGDVKVVGAVYDLATGKVRLLD